MSGNLQESVDEARVTEDGAVKILDNVSALLGDDIKSAATPGARLKIAASCFSIYAFEALKEELSRVGSLEFIFTAPTFVPEDVADGVRKERREFYIPKVRRESGLHGTEFEIQLRNKLTQRAIARECAQWIRKKVAFRSNTTKAPMQQFMYVATEDAETAYMPISGFTAVDLGFQRGNAISNFVTRFDDPSHTRIYLQLFNQIWADPAKVQDVTSAVCDHIESVYQENAPERIYLLMLNNIFQDFLDDIDEDVLPNDRTGYRDSVVWNKLFNFQKDAATGIINKLETYNGCILADSVGLGKTFTALAVIKYYELRNRAVLVLCPKKLADNWRNYNSNLTTNILARDRFNYDVLCHTDLSRTSGDSFGMPLNRVNWGNYDLVVIDESHNFRNNDIYKDRETRYQKLMDKVIRAGVKTKVLMLSANPGNRKLLIFTAFADTANYLYANLTPVAEALHELESFSSDAGVNVMVINTQAFAARGADNLRIYEELDDFQSRRPIDVIASNRPIVILDEPQKMEGKATTESLPKFKPLMILRYSATHKTQHNRVHRLDALDAYNQKLVKKIEARGIHMRGLSGTGAYLFLEGVDISKKAPLARIELEVRRKSGEIKRELRRLEYKDNLFELSGKLDQYRGFTISQIDYTQDTVEFSNGVVLTAGEGMGDMSEQHLRRIQIRETIKAHLDRERQLFDQGIKVLSLFFIDEVAKYRDYAQADEKGEYARVFEEEYALVKAERLAELPLGDEGWRAHLAAIDAAGTHKGYFSIDKATGRLKDPELKAKSTESEDVDAYDLILKDKESLLTFPAPTDSTEVRAKREVRFIFSHSALREGWDNPNVFVICMLKHSDNTISRRQEVGRGLRLAVNQKGERMDHLATVHDINVLTVVANESYKSFVKGLQSEISQALSSRPRHATEAYFTGKMITTDKGPLEVTPVMAKLICNYLIKNDYKDIDDQITKAYHDAKREAALADLPDALKAHGQEVFKLIDSVFSEEQLNGIGDGRPPKTNPLNGNFQKKEFQDLWARINHKAIYQVDFDSHELITKSVSALDSQLKVTPLQYVVETGVQDDEITDTQLSAGEGFKVTGTGTHLGGTVRSLVKYDLVGKIAEKVELTRQTTAAILSQIQPSVFAQFQTNPEHFLSEASRIIKEQKASTIIERLTYDLVSDSFKADIFTGNQTGKAFTRASRKLKKHIYDYALTDSNVETQFVEQLDTSEEVVVYAKLPRGFFIPTPVGDYNPDWAISFTNGLVKHVYFVAETKGSMSSLELRVKEDDRIKCARKFFDELGRKGSGEKVKYDVVTDYHKLMDIVGRAP